MHPDLRARIDFPDPGSDTGAIMLLDRYELLRSVGQGGMADVYEAWDHQLERRVAIKVLRERYALDPAFVERFLREASATAGLAHPNIATVFDAGSDRGMPFIVMEFVAGRTLREVVEDRGRLPVAAAAAAVAAAATALGAAHAAGLVHRDVKPGNIMVTADAVKVVDFGIARAADADPTGAATNVLGTPSYMSPEQAQGVRMDARSDIYGLGVCLYELLTGVPPFTGDNGFAIAYQHVNATPRPPSELRGDLPPSIEAVVLRAMAKDPGARYQTAAAMREAIELAMAVRSRPGATGARALLPTRPFRPGAGQGAPASGGLPWAASPRPPARSAPPLPAPSAPPRSEPSAGHATEPSAPLAGPERGSARGSAQVPPRRAAGRRRGDEVSRRRVAVLALAVLLLAALGALAAVPSLRGRDVFQALPPAAAQAQAPSLPGAAPTTPGRMPYLRGLSLGAARSELRLAGVGTAPTVKGVVDAAVPAGLVLASSPGPGTAVGARTRVTLVVSIGPAPGVAVPGVTAPAGTAPGATGTSATTPTTAGAAVQAPATTTTSTTVTTGRGRKGRGRGRPPHPGSHGGDEQG